jgi:hypothetical protein
LCRLDHSLLRQQWKFTCLSMVQTRPSQIEFWRASLPLMGCS